MTRDTYERALKSAAQIAFLSFVAGCGGATAVDPPEQKPNSQPVADEEQSTVAPAKTTYGGSHLSDKSCKNAIHAAYPNGDPQWYGEPTPPQPTSMGEAGLVKCCEQVYFKGGHNDGTNELHDSGCCSVLRIANSPSIGIACTPWGPPMPVATRRTRRGRA